jgi:hypothetical protein
LKSHLQKLAQLCEFWRGYAMSQSASKRRICSYDMLEVRPDGYTLTETEGEMYFSNARCLCIWAVQLATRPNLADGRKLPRVQLTQPNGEQRMFADVGELAKWSVANALDNGKQSLSDH